MLRKGTVNRNTCGKCYYICGQLLLRLWPLLQLWSTVITFVVAITFVVNYYICGFYRRIISFRAVSRGETN